MWAFHHLEMSDYVQACELYRHVCNSACVFDSSIINTGSRELTELHFSKATQRTFVGFWLPLAKCPRPVFLHSARKFPTIQFYPCIRLVEAKTSPLGSKLLSNGVFPPRRFSACLFSLWSHQSDAFPWDSTSLVSCTRPELVMNALPAWKLWCLPWQALPTPHGRRFIHLIYLHSEVVSIPGQRQETAHWSCSLTPSQL